MSSLSAALLLSVSPAPQHSTHTRPCLSPFHPSLPTPSCPYSSTMSVPPPATKRVVNNWVLHPTEPIEKPLSVLTPHTPHRSASPLAISLLHRSPPPLPSPPLFHFFPLPLSDKLGKRLGQPGQFGQALQAHNLQTGEVRAVKVISKARFTRHSDQKYHFDSLRAEIDVMKKMQHPNIIKLHEVYESAQDLYLVMECCSGGELFDRIKEQGSYSEQDAAAVMRQMTEGIRYMHKSGIAQSLHTTPTTHPKHFPFNPHPHLCPLYVSIAVCVVVLVSCDLKPDNFLFFSPAKDSPIKIIDFGMSKFVQKRKYFQVICGTPVRRHIHTLTLSTHSISLALHTRLFHSPSPFFLVFLSIT